jgi:hypothetical protein
MTRKRDSDFSEQTAEGLPFSALNMFNIVLGTV